LAEIADVRGLVRRNGGVREKVKREGDLEEVRAEGKTSRK
jgi:hypothetical protein